MVHKQDLSNGKACIEATLGKTHTLMSHFKGILSISQIIIEYPYMFLYPPSLSPRFVYNQEPYLSFWNEKFKQPAELSHRKSYHPKIYLHLHMEVIFTSMIHTTKGE